MKKLKIAEIITRMDWAGSPDIARIICKSLKEDQHDVKLITGPTANPSASTKRFLDEFKDNIILVSTLRRNTNPLFDIIALFELYLILKKERFDIIHTHTAKGGALGRLAAYLSGNRHIIHMMHGHNFYGYFNSFTSALIVFIERLMSKFTTRFVALSELEKKDLIKFGVADERRIKIVPSGMDLEFKNIDRNKAMDKKKEFGFGVDRKIVGMVSRLEAVKGPLYFIEATYKVSKEIDNVGFIIIGEGGLRKSLEVRSKELGIGDKIVFAGWRDDVLDIISFLDVLVQPSLNEAIGRVLLEAQGLGVPVVATNVGGIPEAVKDGITGILVPPQNSEKLAIAILGLLKDSQKWRGMSEKAREWVGERFSATRMMEEIKSLYEEIILL